MIKEKRLKLQNDLASIIYNDIKDYVDSNDDLTYMEAVGILEYMKEYFLHNSTLNIIDIRIKRDIKKDFVGISGAAQKPEWYPKC